MIPLEKLIEFYLNLCININKNQNCEGLWIEIARDFLYFICKNIIPNNFYINNDLLNKIISSFYQISFNNCFDIVNDFYTKKQDFLFIFIKILHNLIEKSNFNLFYYLNLFFLFRF